MFRFFTVIPGVTVLLSLVLVMSNANADTFESLLMPGPVIKGHEKYEQKCDQCHDTSRKKQQGHLCMKCHAHENILDDISNNKGFHGRLPAKVKSECKHCHTDHEGRDAQVVLLNPLTFKHDSTDFPLEGIHKTTSCNACHEEDKKHAETPVDCYSCHKSADVHKGKQGKKCGDCHKPSGWKQTGFDHDKTDFPLKGSHEEAGCTACHINQKYKDTPKQCISCHQIDDIHRGSFGKKCDSCHSEKKWDVFDFDHNRKTDFPLYGKHKKATCNSCHKPDDIKEKLPKTCHGCHKNDDSHKGQYGNKCKNCHSTSSWQKQKFDHNKTEFSLLGKHKDVARNHCHKGGLYEDKLKTDCITCHEKDDAHKGKQGRTCNNCHNETGWNKNVLFDHDLASFPLIGMHAITACEECHLSSDYSRTDSDCNQCHAGDDVHETKLGTDCESCHNPNTWNVWLFDHDKSTDFTIDGAHEDLGCYDCHKSRSSGKLKASSECISCHRRQDIHNRDFGRDCGRCHSTKSFRDINIKY